MAFHIDASGLIKKFGQDIKVWRADSKPKQAYPGGPVIEVSQKMTDENSEKRHEPVLPISPKTALGAELLAGGVQLQGMLVWYSTDKFKAGTVVEVPNQGGKYTVTSFSGYSPYSNFYEYVLKGDSQNGVSNE